MIVKLLGAKKETGFLTFVITKVIAVLPATAEPVRVIYKEVGLIKEHVRLPIVGAFIEHADDPVSAI